MKLISFLVFFAIAPAYAAEPKFPVGIEDLSFIKGFKAETLKAGRFDFIETDTFKMWMSTIVKGSPLKPHRHMTGRWVIPLEDATIYRRFNRRAQKPIGKMEWKKGQAYFYEADPKDVFHNDENNSETPVQVIVIAYRNQRSEAFAEEMKAGFDELDDRSLDTAEVESSVQPK